MQGLYVHIPFCSIKCHFCDFVAFSGQNASIPRYLEALRAEASFYGDFAPDTLYLGGGTPTELSAAQLASLLSSLGGRYGDLAHLREVTVEANPESLSPEKLDVLRRAGVTRLSLGIQSSQDRLLESLGRRHSWKEAERAFREARAHGFSVNADLMFAVPGQTMRDLKESIGSLLSMEPEHVSAYGLHVGDRTLFRKRGVEVDDDLSRDMMETVIETLTGAGYRHYELSNYALPGEESLHNTIYWEGGDYLGLGCGASGYLGGLRYQNERRLKDYLERVEAGGKPAASSERLEGREKLGESMMTGLRLLKGVELTPGISEAFGPEIEEFKSKGLLREEEERLCLTRMGIFLSDMVFRAFVAEPAPMGDGQGEDGAAQERGGLEPCSPERAGQKREGLSPRALTEAAT